MKTSRVLRIVFLSIVLGCVGPAFSQSSTGSISGTVTDQNNAVVVGATVIGKNTATGFVRPAVTNSSGLYRLTDIPSGPYEITIEAASFKKHSTERHHTRCRSERHHRCSSGAGRDRGLRYRQRKRVDAEFQHCRGKHALRQPSPL